jgi:hypothetical protein
LYHKGIKDIKEDIKFFFVKQRHKGHKGGHEVFFEPQRHKGHKGGHEVFFEP